MPTGTELLFFSTGGLNFTTISVDTIFCTSAIIIILHSLHPHVTIVQKIELRFQESSLTIFVASFGFFIRKSSAYAGCFLCASRFSGVFCLEKERTTTLVDVDCFCCSLCLSNMRTSFCCSMCLFNMRTSFGFSTLIGYSTLIGKGDDCLDCSIMSLKWKERLTSAASDSSFDEGNIKSFNSISMVMEQRDHPTMRTERSCALIPCALIPTAANWALQFS